MENKEFEKFIKKDDAFDTQQLIADVDLDDVMAEIDLEEILAEYASHHAAAPEPEMDDDEVWVNEGYTPKPVQMPEESAAPPPVQKERHSAADWDPEPQDLYDPSRDVSAVEGAGTRKPVGEELPGEDGIPLEEVMAQVVDAVMDEEEAKRREAQPVQRRGLFSRRLRAEEETEPLGGIMEETQQEQTSYAEEEDPEEEEEPERSSEEASDDYHRRYKQLRKRSRPAMLVMLLALAFAVVEYSGRAAAYLNFEISAIISLGLLAMQLLLCFPVVIRAVTELFHGRGITPELMVSVFALVTAADAACVYLVPERGMQLPLGAVAAATLYFTMRGEMLRLRGLRDTCHMATYGEDPFVVTAVAGGFRKQSCGTEGYIRMTERESEQIDWYRLLLPVILTATLVFAVLVSVTWFDQANFFWYWSAILGAASVFTFTAAFGAPLGKLARRLQRDGCAISGYSGAELMSRKGSMVLTDGDLFPPGTVFMNGMKVYAHDALQAVSYASSLVDASGCGLKQVFDDLRRSQGGHSYPVEDFSFYEEGGISGTIRGESVILGHADFMAQMGVRLPKDIKLKTGVFLAVDQELAAVFAVKYMASDNVDAALQAILNNGIKPVFAVRDFNITPALIKRKFKINTKKRCLYPKLPQRLALSEEEYESDGRAGALLFRAGLMPYAETVIGGERMHGAVRKNCLWALLGSICGTLLAFYLTFVGGFQVLTPASMLFFQLFWAVPSVMVNGWVTRY